MTEPTHWYGPKRPDKYRNCNPVCSAEHGTRVPDTAAGIAKHDAAHAKHGAVLPLGPTVPAGPALPTVGRLPYVALTAAQIAGGVPCGSVYYPAMPISLADNVSPGVIDWPARKFGADYWWQYCHPDGERQPDGRLPHAYIGGWVRNRPPPRDQVTSEDFWLADCRTEIARARAAGLSYFKFNLMVLPRHHPWQHLVADAMLTAADQSGFSIWLMIDMTASVTLHSTKAELAAYIARLAAHPSARRTPDGRLMLSAFTCERQPVAWYTELFAVLKANHGITVSFYPLFQNQAEYDDVYAAISDGWNDWGDRTADWNDPSPTGKRRANIAHCKQLGKNAGATISIQGYRPREGIFDESKGTLNLRRTAQIARESGAAYVDVMVWNDYTEGDVASPTYLNGSVFTDLVGYFVAEIILGRAPAIGRDQMHVTHRMQFVGAPLSYERQTVRARLRGADVGVVAVNKAEAFGYLTAPADIEIRSGSKVAIYRGIPAGLTAGHLVDLDFGAVSCRVIRNGLTVVERTSPHLVTEAWREDLQYVAA